jgi:F0F1-type ATP synthase assembly protein I
MTNQRTSFASLLSAIGLGVVLATLIQYYFATSLIINSLIAVIFLLLGIIMFQLKSSAKDDTKKEEI